MRKPEPETLFTVKQVASRLRVSRAVIYRLIRRGHIKAEVRWARFGPHQGYRIREAELHAFLRRSNIA